MRTDHTQPQIYRTYLVWDNMISVIVLPALMLIASTSTIFSTLNPSTAPLIFDFQLTQVTGIIGNLGATNHDPHAAMVLNQRLASYVLTLAVNVLCTLLISFRLWRLARDIGAILGGRCVSKYYSMLVVIVESAVMYTVVTALAVGFYAGDTGVGNLLRYINPQVLVRSSSSSPRKTAT